MSRETVRVTDNLDYAVEHVDRSIGGAKRDVLVVRGSDGAVSMGKLSVDKSGGVSVDGLKIAGAITLPVYTQLSRPDASTLPAGSMIWNSTSKQPEFSDGAAWYDADGVLT